MKIVPFGDRVLIRRRERESVSKGGILIPDTAKDKPQLGTVEAVGPGQRLDDGTLLPMRVAVGDKVLFQHWAGNDIRELGDEMVVMREGDILGIVIE